jgi:hypothetical protein
MERLSIKNVEFSERLSEETNAFGCDVYLDNKKFASARNDGRGGSTFLQPYPGMRDKLGEAEAYATSLPSIKYGKHDLKMSLDFAVDILFEKWLEMKDVRRLQTKGIVFKTKEGGISYTKGPLSIKQQLENPILKERIQKRVNEFKAEGHTILNTNLKGIKI